MKTEGTPPPNSTAEEELEAWREVHKKLSLAVLVAKEAVDVAKAQRRFWCEEIHANLTPEGKLLNTSTWKKSVRRGPAKRKPAADKGGSAAKRPRKSQDSSLKIRLKLKAPSPSPSQSSSSEVPILPNSAPTTIAQLFGGDPNSMPPMADAQVPAMSPMQAAQQGGRTTPSSYAPSGHFIGKVLPPTMGMAPYSAAQVPAAPVLPVPNAQPLGAYASVLQGEDDSDTASEDDE